MEKSRVVEFFWKGLLSAILTLFWGGFTFAAVNFSAEVSQQQIGENDTFSLSLNIQSDGQTNIESIYFDAPDFEVLNQSTASQMSSAYDSTSGRFQTTHTQRIIKVLHPLKKGRLAIRKIQAKVDGKVYSAQDIQVEVTTGGASGSGSPQGGLRGAQKISRGREVFLRAEVDRQQAYRGEEILLSYFIYSRVRVYGISVDKFPELKGFLRQEIVLPAMGSRLDWEPVVLNGVQYERSLLARYALYPLQDGKLKIDEVTLKYNYLALDEEQDADPFFQLFRQGQPRMGVSKSESVSIDVSSLPTSGRPPSFSGGVGSFSMVSAVDKYQVKANEAVTLTVKIEGKGNLASISEPKAQWPDQVELYHSKSKINERSKIFEYLLIPRAPGKVTLPQLEFSYFDPSKKQFVTTQTEPVTIEVLPGSSDAPAQNPSLPQGLKASRPPAEKQELRPIKPPSAVLTVSEGGFFRWLYLGCVGISCLLMGWVSVDLLRRGGRSLSRRRTRGKGGRYSQEKDWSQLRQAIDRMNRASLGSDGVESSRRKEIAKNYEALSSLVFDALDRAYGVSVRSIPRSQLGEILVMEREMDQALWKRIEHILEFGEFIRFAGTGGPFSEQTAVEDLKKWVHEAESITQMLDQKSNRD